MEILNSENATRWPDKQKIHKAQLCWIIYTMSYVFY